MSLLLEIYRGGTQLADGLNAKCEGLPLGSVEHLLDVVGRIRASASEVLDRFTRTTTFSFTISKQHGTLVDAMHHILTELANTGVYDFQIRYDDGTTTHSWNLLNAGWKTASAEDHIGLRTVIRYEVVGGVLQYNTGGLLTEQDGNLLTEQDGNILQ